MGEGSKSRSIIQFMFIILFVFFSQSVIIPFLIPEIAGTPTAWILSGAAGIFSWIFIKLLLWNVKRERIVA